MTPITPESVTTLVLVVSGCLVVLMVYIFPIAFYLVDFVRTN